MSRLLLGFNVDHVATVRNARNTKYPDPVYAACIAEQSGADSIIMHLREDRRHVKDQDVILARKMIQIAMNLEIAVTEEMINFACKLQPDYCCLVPERRHELTTEGGLDVVNQMNKLRSVVSKLMDLGIRVSLFIDPDIQQIAASYKIGVAYVELHTGLYAESYKKSNYVLEYQRIKDSIKCCVDYGLKINVGHGLNYYNVESIAMLPQIREVNIGHAIVSRSMCCGLSQAIIDMKKLLQDSRKGWSDK